MFEVLMYKVTPALASVMPVKDGLTAEVLL